MKEEEKKLLRSAIEKKMKRMQREIIDLKELTKPIAPENAIGRLSRMEAIGSKSVAEASLRNYEDRLAKMKEALNNLHKDDFGKCAKCNSEIPFMRLKLMPHSRYCVKCAQ